MRAISKGHRTRIVDPSLEQALTTLKGIRADAKACREADREMTTVVKEIAQRFRDEYPGQAGFDVGERKVTFSMPERRKVSVERLLELGVDPKVVEQATEISRGESMRVS